MVQLSLKVRLPDADATKTISLNPSLIVYDACKVIRDKFPETTNLGKASDYGLFLNDEDIRKGRWLDPNRTLEFYLLRNGDSLEYKKKIRPLKVRMLDNSVKMLMVDESQTLKQLLPIICSKIGLSQYEEYDLVRETREEDNKENARRLSESGTIRKGTLPRDRDQKKMEKLKLKLATDDDVAWVDQSRTLIQQGVDEGDVLLLKRRFFYSDQNIDARDPVQLNLLYVQCRDAILSGAHPVTYEQATQFAGLQAQAEYGDYNENVRNIRMDAFLPGSYRNVKTLDKRIFEEWNKGRESNELQAKVQYIKLARTLETYGVTFFLVKEKMKGRNKLVPRLFGVTKNSCMRLNEKTKEIETRWPLTQVKRWAASPNTFTLDFGDYADEYYSVQTQEGEQIAQLIAGYIDIILKRQKPKDHFGIGGEEGCTLEEDEVLPAKISIIQPRETRVEQIVPGNVAMPGILRDINNERPIRAIEAAKIQLVKTVENLHKPAVLPPVRAEDPVAKQWVLEKLEMNKQSVGTQMAQITRNVAQVVNLTAAPVQERDHVAVDRAINTIEWDVLITYLATNLDEMVDGIKVIAELLDDERKGDELFDAAQKLCKAFSDLLDAAKPGEAPRQELLTAATKVGEASKIIMDQVDPLSVEYQDGLVTLAKGVANATAVLVRKAKLVASATDNMELQNKIIAAATATALSTSELVACAKVLLPTINSPECQDQLVDAVRKVAKTVQDLLDACKISGVEKHLLEDLNEAAARVTAALNELLGHVKQGPEVTPAPVPHVAALEVITESSRHLVAAPEPAEMIRQAKVLAQATAELVKGLKSEAEGVTDKDLQRRLLAASKELAEATTRLVDAAKLCASQPQDPGRRQAMRDAAVNIRELAVHATYVEQPDERSVRLKKLEAAAKRVASTSTQTISASQAATPSNANPGSQQNLVEQCRIVAERLSKLIGAIKLTSAHPNDQAASIQLINNCEDTIYPAEELVSAAKAAVPTVQDRAAGNRLRETAGELSIAIGDLRTNLNKMREVQPITADVGVDVALSTMQSLERDLDAMKRAAQNGTLVPLTDDTVSGAGVKLYAYASQVTNATTQLINASAQGDETFVADASQNVAKSLQDFTSAARGVAASIPEDRDNQLRMLDSAQEVVERSAYLVDSVRDAFGKPRDQASDNKLLDAAREVTNALNRCLGYLPDERHTKDMTRAITTVEETKQKLHSSELTIPIRSTKPFAEIHIRLNQAAQDLNEAAGEVVTSTYSSSDRLGTSATHYTEAYQHFVDGGMQVVSVETERERQLTIIRGLEDVSSASARLLALAKQTHGQSQAPYMKNQLQEAARAVTDSINNLITYCAGSLPSQRECDNAIRRIQMLRSLLDNCAVPVNNRTYYESLDAVLDSSRVLGDGMTGISDACKHNQTDHFIQAVRTTADAVSALIENSAQAAYLIGISDPSSVVGKAGIIDQKEVSDAIAGIQEASRVITNPGPVNQQQILQAATVIAKYSHTLCSACRTASGRCANPVAKRQFVQSAKDIATNTANLVRGVKNLDNNFTDANRGDCVTHVHNLLQSVNDLGQYSSSPEFASSAGQLSTGGRKVQEPIVVSGKCIIDASSGLIQAAKSLSVNARDPSSWHSLTAQSKNVSDSVKSLASAIRDRAPGQQECNEAIDRLQNYLRIVDKAALAATSQNLPPRNDNTTEGFYEVTINTSSQLTHTVTTVRDAAKSEAEALGHRVAHMSSYFEPLVRDGVGSASRTSGSKDQMSVLHHLRTVLEASLQFIELSKACGGNPRTRNLHGDLHESADGLLEALNELTQTLERIQSESGFVRTMINNVSSAISKVDQRMTTSEEESFADYQTRMFRTTKEITRITHDINGKAQSDPQELGNLAQQLYNNYNQLAEDSRGAQSSCASDEISQRIRSSVQDLGHASIDLIKVAGAVQSNPQDTYIKDELSRASKLVIEKVSFVLSALQSGSRGTQACINAASTVSGVIGDLDTTIMFATAGTLQAEDENDRFQDHREDILKTAKALVEDTKTLVTGAASSQEQLAVAAQNAVRTIIQLAEVVKSGAASLGKENSESQLGQSYSVMAFIAKRLEMERAGQKVLLINAVRDVASALGDLIHATKAASGKSLNDPAMLYLKDSAKIMVTNVTSLLKTVKTVENESERGTRALEATIEALAQEIRVFDSSDISEGRIATAEDLLRASKPVTQATYKAVTAGKTVKQDDAIIAANMGRKAISDLLLTCRAAANGSESPDTKNKVLSAGRDCALKYRELLHTVHMILTRPDARHLQQNLVPMTQSIASAVALITAAAENMKDSDNWVNPEDPTVIAENELLGAAATIEHAAKRLGELVPRRTEYKVDNEVLNFDEMILEACRQITTATATLIKSACASQAELVTEGKVSARPLYSSEDGQWSDGLISAARTVAAACHNLCEAANSLVQGHATEEKLISSAKQVASSTAQLLVACRVKSDSNSPSMQRLQAAGNAVKRATDMLVRAAQQSLDAYEERSLIINRRIVGGIAQEITAQEEVLIKERELEEARGKLLALRKAKYGDRQSDDEYYGYGASSTSHTYQSETRITEARYTSGYTSQ